jgi:hypothetical protein
MLSIFAYFVVHMKDFHALLLLITITQFWHSGNCSFQNLVTIRQNDSQEEFVKKAANIRPWSILRPAGI